MILKRTAGPMAVLLIAGTLAAAAILGGADVASTGWALGLRSEAGNVGNVPAGAPANPRDLVQEMVANELKAETANDSFWSYRQTTRQNGKSKVEDIVETTKGNLTRLISRDGHALTPDELRVEDAHIRNLASNPGAWQRSQRDVRQDTRKANDFLRVLPQAFNFTYAGEKDGNVDLRATPNPAFHPQGHETEVFHHMAGDIWVNLAQKRMVRIDGRLTSPVEFGGGVLGHLNQGGTFVVTQQEVGPRHWELTKVDVHMTGKALIFKTITVEQQQSCTGFKEVASPMTPQDAAKLLTAPNQKSGQQAGARGITAGKKSGA